MPCFASASRFRLLLFLPSAMEQRRDAQRSQPHLSAVEPPVLDREEVDVSDLDEEEDARNKTTTTKTTGT